MTTRADTLCLHLPPSIISVLTLNVSFKNTNMAAYSQYPQACQRKTQPLQCEHRKRLPHKILKIVVHVIQKVPDY